VVVIKAQAHRSQEQNRDDAMRRLQEMVEAVATPQRVRRPTRPTRSSQRKRLESKASRGQVKQLRGKVTE
jgi:ribosome-associated protein